MKVAWWVGHSYGRYAGSTWYCDTFFSDLRKNCVGYMDIDSPGVKGATIYDEITCMAENWDMASDGDPRRHRRPRQRASARRAPGITRSTAPACPRCSC